MKRRLRIRRHGLTIKLIAVYLGMIVLGVVLISAATQHAFRDRFDDKIRPHLQLYVDYIRADIGEPPQRDRAIALSKKLPVNIYFRDAGSQWSTDGRDAPRLDQIDFWDRHRDRHKRHQANNRPGKNSPVRFGEWGEDDVAVLQNDQHTLFFVTPDSDDPFRPAKLLPLVIVILVFVALYYLTQRLFAPLHTIRDAVTRFGEGDLEQRLALRRRDELGDVARSFDQMADRIKEMLESKRQLLLAISHELRSPLTRARVATALLENPDQRAEIDSELEEMEALIGELLETERLNAGHQALHIETVDLIELLRTAIQAQRDLIDLQLPDETLLIALDSTRIRLVVRNIVENAIKYSRESGETPILSVHRADHSVRIVVRDFGEGIAAEHLNHIGDAFYRVDPARQRATGGYGLGLYLCRVIIEAHRGTLQIESVLGEGTTITAELPTNLPVDARA